MKCRPAKEAFATPCLQGKPSKSSSGTRGCSPLHEHGDLHDLVALVVRLGAAAAGVAAHRKLDVDLQGGQGSKP